MAKITSSPRSPKVKPLTSRPLDLLYFGFFILHFTTAVAFDVLPLWPSFVQEIPVGKHLYGAFKAASEEYTRQTNDPYMLSIWGLVERPWEYLFMKALMWMTLYVLV